MLGLLLLLSVSLSGEVVLSNVVHDRCRATIGSDNDMLQFHMNIDYLLCEFFMCSATGKSCDQFDPSLAARGPPPFGCRRGNFDPLYRQAIEDFGFIIIGHLRATARALRGRVIPRPLLNISREAIARSFVNGAFRCPLTPPFDPYAAPDQHAIVAQFITYTASLLLNGAIPRIRDRDHLSLVGKLLGMRAGQNAVFRGRLYRRSNATVVPYEITLAEFTKKTAELVNRQAKCGVKDEGVIVPRSLGAENRTEINILAADVNSLMYTRTPQEVLRIVYGSGNESVPGGFFPKGANGRIAERFRRSRND
ncbi:desiccation-related protein PCC13-62-like [Cucumis melo]|uniref:Desiccation-related protein PCC13-62-like n=1 Tax=Cucumis melo TaxID=3656 RepID=A0A1S4DZA6_CUCME|nr:desiccation-related protein PCC13-62-like [Cucumis melo]